MKKIASVVALFLLLFTACDCAPAASSYKASQISTGPSETASVQREQNKALSNHIVERSLQVERDCTVKKGYIVVGTSSPNTYLDGRGSASIVSSHDGKTYLFSAAHVISPDKQYAKAYDCEITVGIRENGKVKFYPAEIFFQHIDSDIVVLSVDIETGLSSELELDPFPGQQIWSAGYPHEYRSGSYRGTAVSTGSLAAVWIPGKNKSHGRWHRVTSEIYFGNSGGGSWSAEGKLAGVVSFLYTGIDPQVPIPGYYYIKPVGEIVERLKASFKYQEVFGE